MATILDGKKISLEIRESLKEEVKLLSVVPGLAVILVGNSAASEMYVRMKKKACEEIGIRSFLHHLSESTTEDDLLHLMDYLNNDPRIHGILVQLPLPEHIREQKIIETISQEKDVDGFHPYNNGQLITGGKGFIPCTPYGIMELLSHATPDVKGKNAVIIGHSNIVGKPTAMMLLNRGATIFVCHKETKNIIPIVQQADIVVIAVGQPKMLKAEWIKEGAIVIDVGTNKLEDGTICGDVDFNEVKEKASFISPSPGGVGPMTIAMLMRNTVESAKQCILREIPRT
jgi:methylenetetrahydrofolate dehydrogenase (NADP+)/methenyltetrahydrofolate cyclohydrolase